MSVRTRYAPSPTGLQHIGGVRTALFNYFFAKSRGGEFILRIEDTDRQRYSDEAYQDLLDTFAWLGIEWDEGPGREGKYGPYIQSERVEIHQQYAQKLIEEGYAYYCFCTPERLDSIRKEQMAQKKKVIGYDRHCRNLSPEEASEKIEKGIPHVIRFKVPEEGSTLLRDILLGDIKRKNEDISPDPVLLKTDGFPTYHLANVIDDRLMEISHILRAQEWIPSGPLHVLLYKAFGWEPPIYCHLPMVMGKDGQKLSKRHGATSVREFRTAGYLPEAVINYVSLVGWSYDDAREFFSKEELESLFTLDKLNKAPGVFDYKKLEWFNGQYIRKMDDSELRNLIVPRLAAAEIISSPPTPEEGAILKGMMPIVKERLKTLGEAPEMVRFLFHDVKSYNINEVIPKKLDREKTLEVLLRARTLVENMKQNNDEKSEVLFRDAAEELGVKLGAILMPVRVSLTGTTVSPPLFESIRLLGIDAALKRIDRVIALLKEVKE